MSRLLIVLSIFLGAALPVAHADSADCEILEIEATAGKGGIDPALKSLEAKLRKPPFSSWKTFKLLKRHNKKIEKMKALELALVSRETLSLLYRDRSDTQGKKPRLRLSFTIDGPDGTRQSEATIKLDSGDHYMYGGKALKSGGTYIAALACTVK